MDGYILYNYDKLYDVIIICSVEYIYIYSLLLFKHLYISTDELLLKDETNNYDIPICLSICLLQCHTLIYSFNSLFITCLLLVI